MNEPATPTTARRGFFPLVHGDEVDLRQAGAAGVLARGDVSIRAGGANLLVTGGDLHIEQGGGQTLLAAGDVTIRQGGTIVAAARSVKVDRGWVGLALGGRVDLDDSRVLLGPVEALALGAGLGMVAACAKWCARRCSGG
jgi:hypothetical protein